MTKDILVEKVQRKIEEIVLSINTEMRMNGDTDDESQRGCLINRICDFEHYVNDTQNSDMKSSLAD